MGVAYCLMNHVLTEGQRNELFVKYACSQVCLPPAELSLAWCAVPVDIVIAKGFFTPFLSWIDSFADDSIFVIQGEAGASFALVDYAMSHHLTVLHSVTERKAKETRNGEKVFRMYEFEHVCFRKYFRMEDL